MSTSIPTSEPRYIVAGDRVRWTKSLPDYPLPTWTLTYAFTAAGWQTTVTAVDDGEGRHLVDIPSSETATWPTVRAKYQAHVTDGTSRYTVEVGPLEIRPDFAAVGPGGYDSRSEAERYLDWLYDRRAEMSDGVFEVQSYQIGGRNRIFRSLEDLDKAIKLAEYDVNRERTGSRVADGLGHAGHIRARF